MKVRVLGCSGAIAKDCRTTSFLLDESVLIDAGTGVGDLTLEEMCKIDHVFLTHSHLDHIAALPLMLDAVSSLRHTHVEIHALPETIEALRTHIFNDVIWPDFERIPSLAQPFLRFTPMQQGEPREAAGLVVEALPAFHTVAAVGYAVKGATGWWVFSGDTERNPMFWERVKQLPVAMLIIETAFSDRESTLAQRSLHLSPRTLLAELQSFNQPGGRVYITHTKPAQTDLIMSEICELYAQAFPDASTQGLPPLSIHWLQAGQEFNV
ncbi:3',5'-cyclic-nucleotide phosphodiesterase [Acidovorax sp. Leaf76]|uniref:3',5'-cyclic-nucleotide phosphodiesterase n=1 Tax=unclassified Acidovorax TaxID=2684926 RepID=UPI0006F4AE54|nr:MULTISPECIES: 3',5'-cyclic-nucleotide phosphodiesterase [unclassified Acidovorax]KQO26829.1 3',5'-cyclic-nucleotide phosphodiesterase [Acidovorax sp. Leaf76]KQO40597.1 3',5'-cyclic-nucleotide phosphodiesterase [Acidovorax sp. Leaf84]KQS42742.1 3',5'-cyclic-nucleotide phosphodiesterase [Acidovorax sp. Leaf191]